MHCLIAAGGSASPDDPMYSYTGDRPKSLLDMGGRPMVVRVVDALQSARHVEDILIVGLSRETAEANQLRFNRPVDYLPDQGSLLANVLAGVAWFRQYRPETEVVLGCSADIPCITGEIIDSFIEGCAPWDKAVYYNFVTRDVLERRFPNSRRTYTKLKGLEVAGGDMAIARLDALERNSELLGKLADARKHPWQVARIVGFGTLLKFLFRRLTIADIEQLAERVLGLPAAVVLNQHAEIAMDADKPYQVDILRAEFARNNRQQVE